MTMRMVITAAALFASASVVAAPAPPAFVYCTAPSTSPRGAGLIVTGIFRSRSEVAFIQTAFTNYLRSSYAPYGNAWMFPEQGATCLGFTERRKAEIQRNLDISHIPQPTQSIFNVTFQLG